MIDRFLLVSKTNKSGQLLSVGTGSNCSSIVVLFVCKRVGGPKRYQGSVQVLFLEIDRESYEVTILQVGGIKSRPIEV